MDVSKESVASSFSAEKALLDHPYISEINITLMIHKHGFSVPQFIRCCQLHAM
jgi:hypothetical protein